MGAYSITAEKPVTSPDCHKTTSDNSTGRQSVGSMSELLLSPDRGGRFFNVLKAESALPIGAR